MLRKTRIILAALFLIGITLLCVGVGAQWWGWMAKLQFLPSCLALNLAVIVGITLLTLLFGRIYCSVICPMGVFQDFVIWLRRKTGHLFHKTKKFEFSKERKISRYIVLGILVAALVTGTQFIVALIAPYSAYGRIVNSIAGLSSGQSIAPALLITASVTLIAIVLCAWLWGRAYCNNVCPVGTVLSLFSRFSLFRPTINTDKCINCGKCGRDCKASCIDTFNHKIDYTRCLSCFDCLDNCSSGAIKYRLACTKKTKAAEETSDNGKDGTEGSDNGRRQFILTTALLGGAAISAAAQSKHLDGGLAEVTPKQNPERSERLVPFGSRGVEDFYSRCTACQLCVSACPNGVLRPSTDLKHLLQPVMGYEKGYCRPECTECSKVCPSGAILPISKEEKLITHIGRATLKLELCLSAKGEARCGNCSRHCPVGAIRMVRNESGMMIPVVNEELCIGCGACENLCPSRPISAITVNGLSVHHE